MSSSRDLNYTCPYCGREFTITIYESVNAAEDRDLRDRAVNGDLFHHLCPHCAHEFLIQNDLVYTDPEHKFLIFLSEKDPYASLQSLAKPLLEKGWKLRRCSNLKDFAEKIQIFEDGANDIEVELAKYDSFIEFLDNKKGNAEDVSSVDYQRTENGVMKINIRTDDKGMSFLIPVSMLDEALEENKELYSIDESTFPEINSSWIISLFTEGEPAGEA